MPCTLLVISNVHVHGDGNAHVRVHKDEGHIRRVFQPGNCLMLK